MSGTNRNGSVVSFPSGDAAQQHDPYNGQPEIRLPRRISAVAIVCLALPFLYLLANVAFTPAGMHGVVAGTAAHLRWLGLSSDGNRIAGFILFGLGIVGLLGFVRHNIIRHYGFGAFGWLEICLGVSLICGAVAEWHLNQLGLIAMIGIIYGGCGLASWGWRNVQNDQGPAGAPQSFQSQTLPEQTVYGAARAALDEEIHNALRDRPTVGNGTYRFKE